MAIRVLVVDRQEVAVQELGDLLREQSGITVVTLATGAQEAIALVGELKPDVVVLDVTMSGKHDVDVTGRILEEFPEVNVLARALDPSRRAVSRLLAAGASGYILKTCSVEELVRAIKAVASGKAYLSPEITCGGEGRCSQETPPDKQMPPAWINARELQVLQCLAEGANVSEIAARIRLTVRAVESHRRRIMDRLGIGSIAGLKEYAVRRGLSRRDAGTTRFEDSR